MSLRRMRTDSSDDDDDDDDDSVGMADPDLVNGAAKLLQELSTTDSNNGARNSSIPVGHWRDGLWDLFRYGYCHGSVMTSCCCVPLAAAQAMARLQLNWDGSPIISHSKKRIMYRTVMIAVVLFWLTRIVMFLLIAMVDPNTDEDVAEWIEPGATYYTLCAIDDVLAYVYMAVTVVLLRNVRQQMRAMYALPTTYCNCAEDTCCALLCPCLVAAQMLRHTADYDQYPSRCCCSDTGLPINAPSII